MAELINGVEISKLVLSEVAKKLTLTKSENPGFNVVLAIVQVGNRPDSNVYIGAKIKKAKEIGAEGRLIKLPDTTTQSELEAEICKLNVDDDIDGIIVQLPLDCKNTIDVDGVVDKIHPLKVILIMYAARTWSCWGDQKSSGHRLQPCLCGTMERPLFVIQKRNTSRSSVVRRTFWLLQSERNISLKVIGLNPVQW